MAVLLATHAQSLSAFRAGGVAQERLVPMATSGNNLYMAWPNNDTGHWNVFFAKSIDSGKTLKTMMISVPNKGHTIDQNTQISASGSKCMSLGGQTRQGLLCQYLERVMIMEIHLEKQ